MSISIINVMQPNGAGLFNGSGADEVAPVVPLFSRLFSTTPELGDDATFTRATTATITDHEGVIREVNSGEARFEGMRRVENLISSSENLTEGWAALDGAVIDSATRFTLSGGSSSSRVEQIITIPSSQQDVTIRLKVRAGDTGSINAEFSVQLRTFGQLFIAGTPVFLTEEYRTISFTGTPPAGETSVRLSFRDNESVSVTIDATEIQLELVTGQTNQNPSEYVSVGVESAPYHGTGVDGTKYFTTENGNSVADGTQGETELVTNGGFSDTSGWTVGNSGTFTASGQARLENSTTSAAYIQQTIATTASQTYKLRFSYIARNASTFNNIRVSVNNGAIGTYTGSLLATNVTDAPFRYVELDFIGASSQATIHIYVNSSTAGDFFVIDNFSIKEYTAANDTRIVTEATGAAITGGGGLVMDAVFTKHRVFSGTFSVTLGTTYTASAYFKADEDDLPTMSIRAFNEASTAFGEAYVIFDLTNETITENSPATGTLTAIGNGWYRGTITAEALATTSSRVFIYLNGFVASEFDGQGLYCTGVQFEEGSVPTSYIKTEGTATQRNLDELSYSGIAADNETRAVTDAGTVDVDDWDGVVDATIVGADDNGEIDSITVYTTGERPA